MAILGHPFFAGGHDVAAGDAGFTALKQRLVDHGVTIVMAGDTHDLEYYMERSGSSPPVHHFVNGGGGAYLSFGTALSWPADVPAGEWSHYPNRQSVAQKIEARSPLWKRPAWWWTTQFDAWPFSAEWMSAMFDYNVAPFFQSFVEVKVELSAHRIRVIPYGVRGRLTWAEVAASPGVRPGNTPDDGFVEWLIPVSGDPSR